MTEIATLRQEVYDYIHYMLGGGMVDVELDPVHYETALDKALSRYRQRTENSTEESYFFMPTIVDQNTYTLPKEILEVRRILDEVSDLEQAVATVVVYLSRLT